MLVERELSTQLLDVPTHNLLPPSPCTSLNGVSSRSTQDSVACGPGYYSLQGEPLCTPCPAGSRCPQARDSPITCDPGYYRFVPVWSFKRHATGMVASMVPARNKYSFVHTHMVQLPFTVAVTHRVCLIRIPGASAFISPGHCIILSSSFFSVTSTPLSSALVLPLLAIPLFVPPTQRITRAAPKRPPTAPPAPRDTSAMTRRPRPSLARSDTTAAEGLRSARLVSRGTAAPRPPSAQPPPVRSAPKELIATPREPSSSARREPTVSCWVFPSSNKLVLSCLNKGRGSALRMAC